MDASERDKKDREIPGEETTNRKISGQKRSEQKINEDDVLHTAIMQDTIATLPGGIALYKIGEKVETLYFSKGVPELSGYTQEEYRVLIQQDALDLVFEGDRERVRCALREAIDNHTDVDIMFRKNHVNGSKKWVQLHAHQVDEQDG